MSVLISDLVLYGTANMPEADSLTTGGAIDFSKQVAFDASNLTPTLFDLVSSSASDTATEVTYYGRDSTGVVQNETLTATGTTKVAGTKTLERLLYGAQSGGVIGPIASVAGTKAVGDLALISHTLVISAHTMAGASTAATTSQAALAALQTGDGATVAAGMILHTTGGTGPNQIRRILAVNPGGAGADVVAVDRNFAVALDATTTYEVGYGFYFPLTCSSQGVALTGTSTQCLAITRLFATSSADVSGGSTRTYYEEIAWNNNNLTTALTSASLLIEALAGALPTGASMDIALFSALDDTATIANRQTAPTGVTAYTSGSPPQSIAVPAPGNLAASSGAGSATSSQKMVARLTLLAGTAAYEGVLTFRATGTST